MNLVLGDKAYIDRTKGGTYRVSKKNRDLWKIVTEGHWVELE